MSKLLTIGIPTFNRDLYLERLLENILQQGILSRSDVEIVICDNASTDRTEQVVGRYEGKSLPIRYFKSNTNEGPDVNILKTYIHAEGKYVWIIGDDDLIAENFLQALLNEINSVEYSVIHLGFKWFIHMPKKLNQGYVEFIKHNKAYAFEKILTLHSTFISSNIYNKSRLNSMDEISYYASIGTGLIQMHFICNAIAKGGPYLHANGLVIYAQAENSNYYDKYKVFIKNLYKFIGENKLSNNFKKELISYLMRMRVPYLIAESNVNTLKIIENFPNKKIDFKFKLLYQTISYLKKIKYIGNQIIKLILKILGFYEKVRIYYYVHIYKKENI